MRAVAGLILGVIAGFVAALIVGLIAVVATFRIPPGVDPANMDQLNGIVAMMSPTTMLALAIAWLAGGLAGAWAAARVARADWVGWAVTLLVAAYFGLSASAVQLPPAMVAAWVLGPLLGGLLGVRLARRAAAAPVEAELPVEDEATPANP